MSKGHYGKCALCGTMTNLTFEHIPPRSALNHLPSKSIISKEALSLMLSGKEAWKATGLKYDNRQRGMGLYSLCDDCNSKTGAWYGNEYAEIANVIHLLMEKEKPPPNSTMKIETPELYLLRFFKQVVSMFCSLNDESHIDDIREFFLDKESHIDDLRAYVLDKESTSFNKEKYQIFMYLVHSGIKKGIRIFIKNIFNNNTNQAEQVLISEITTYPLGFVMYINPPTGYKAKAVNITDLSDLKYNKKSKCEIIVPVYECYSLMPEDFRSRQEIERTRKSK